MDRYERYKAENKAAWQLLVIMLLSAMAGFVFCLVVFNIH
jgi:hypothetical protein